MQSVARLVCVAPPDLEKVWPHVDGMLQRAIAATGLSAFEDIEAGLFTGAFLLWFAWSGQHIEAIAVTQLAKSGSGKICIIVACSGYERKRWLSLISDIENYAKAEGCIAMRIYGRRGWERVLEGYESKYAIMEKELS